MLLTPLVTLTLLTLTLAWPRSSHFPIPFPSFSLEDGTRPFTVTVEGNVGAGKSTLLNYFLKFSDIAVHKEPLDIWQNLNGTNFLELLYIDQARWGMTFESLASLTFLEIHMADQRRAGVRFKPIKVMERSLHSARHCFMEQLKPLMTSGEGAVLHRWYDLLVNRPEFDTSVDLIIYLRTDPNTAYSRVKSRSRSEEMSIPLEYFVSLHELHDRWLLNKTDTALPQVIVIDANEDISTLQKTYRQLAKDIWKTVNKGYFSF